MGKLLIGTKLGMTRLFEDDKTVPVTVIAVSPNVVTQVKTEETDGYSAVQLGTGEMKPRNSSIPMIAHDAKADTGPLRHHVENRVSADELEQYALGQSFGAEAFEKVAYVDVIGTSKGKGFAGGIKRWGFKGQLATHGVERKHRSPGSIGGHGNNAGKSGRIKKGKKMAGRLGNDRVTVRCLDIVRVDTERGLILVKGPVPGANDGTVLIREAIRLRSSKAAKQAEVAGS